MANNKTLKVQTKPKQPIQINRPLIIAIVAAIVTVLLLAIIAAFSTNKIIKSSPTQTKIITDKSLAMSPELKGLPENYSDIEAIKKYSQPTQSEELEKLLKQFAELKNAYTLLKEELLAKNTTAPEKPPFDPRSQQAKSSSLVFSGLGSGLDPLMGPQTDKELLAKTSGTQPTDLVATDKQADFFKKQAENSQKVAIMKAQDKPEEIYDLHNVVTPASPYQVQAGTIIQATLITGINTTLSGSVIAQVRQNIYDTVTGKYLLIPKGSKLLGEYDYRVFPGQTRVSMAFTRLIRPDGSSILLGRPNSADLAGHSGLEGDVNNHWGQILGASTISTILSFGAGMASDRASVSGQNYQNARQSAFSSAGQGIARVGENITNRAIGIPPTITLPAGYQFTVIVKKDMILTPFNPKA